MLKVLGNAFAIPEIRRKLAFTAAMLALYRLGSFIPVPGIEASALSDIQDNFAGSNILGFLNLFSGGSLSRLSLFALGIMPYITASIILQLLTVVVPSLEKLSKEGEVGQQKITQYTRYLTVLLSALQSLGYVFLFQSFGSSGESVVGELTSAKLILMVTCLTAGAVLRHVARRAGHPARRRQRHLADDLRLDRLRHPERDLGLVEQLRPGLRRDDALRRPRGDRRDRLHPRGAEANTGPVRQTRRRAQDDHGRIQLSAPAREHGGSDPGHLRGLDHGLPADRRPASQHARSRSTSPPSSAPGTGPTSSARSSSSSSSPTSTRRSRSTRSIRPTT